MHSWNKGTEMFNLASEDAVKDHLRNVRELSEQRPDYNEKEFSGPIARY